MRFLISLLLFLTLAPALWAQDSGGSGQETPAAEPQAEGAQGSSDASVQQLIDILENPAALEELVSKLKSGVVPGTDGAGATETASGEAGTSEASAEGDSPEPSIGERFAEVSQDAAQSVANTFVALWAQLRGLPVTLSGLMDAIDPQVIWDALSDLAFVIVATYAAFLLLRWPSGRISARLARRAEGAGWLTTLVLNLVSALVEAITVGLAWAAGYALTLALYDEFGVIQIRQSLYLNAFLSVEMAKVVGRSLLAPNQQNLRLVRLTDGAARALWSWLTWVIAILGYGLLLAVPIANFSAGYFAGSALGLALSVLVILMTAWRVIRARMGVARWLNADAGTIDNDDVETPLLGRLATLWHLPVLAYLAVLLVIVLARPGNVLLPMLQATGLVIATVIVGMMVNDLLFRVAKRGVTLPGYVTYRLPLLQRRLNTMLPRILFALRTLLIAVVVAVSLDLIGLLDFKGWLSTPRAGQLIAGGVSAFFIVLVAFFVWLALASWVEYRLNPFVGKPPTARETTLLTLLRNAAAIGLIILTLMLVLSELGLDIAPLLASAGVLGLAIGFGAQKMVQDIITGIFIQFDSAIDVGDVITVGGVTGVVEKLNVRSVSIRDLNGVFHIIPFSSVDMVSNYMREYAYHVAAIGVAYREDVSEVKQAMHDAFDELRQDPERAENIIDELEWHGVNSFDDSAVTVRARIKTKPGEQWALGRAYNEILKRIFDERNIEIPFPHQTIYFGEDKRGNAPPLHIRRDDLETGQTPRGNAAEDDTTAQIEKPREGGLGLDDG